MKIVLDCNILVMCLTSRSPYHNIYKALIKGGFDLAISTDIMLGYQEIIEMKYGKFTANSFMALLSELSNVHLITTYYRWQLIYTDPDDDKYCDCAIAANADYIVTQDRHFNILQEIKFPAINIIGIEEFSFLI